MNDTLQDKVARVIDRALAEDYIGPHYNGELTKEDLLWVAKNVLEYLRLNDVS